MSKHWKPEGKIVRMRSVGGRRWTDVRAYQTGRTKAGNRMSGMFVGVALAAAACAGIAVGLGQVADGESFAADAATTAPVRASFSYCYRGGGINCVVDGDTFWIGGEKVRIADIDAPETHPPRCAYEARLGNEATEKLHQLLNSGAVTMTSIDRDRDRYGRLLRNVQVNGRDVGEALVRAGLARPWEGRRRPWC
jgi:endonuclease YncB( thermonuclease family)